jgi:hypothetical protein
MCVREDCPLTKHDVVTHSCNARKITPRDNFGGVDAVLRITPPIVFGDGLRTIGGPTNMAVKINIHHLFSNAQSTFIRVELIGASTNDLDVAQIRARMQDTLDFPERITEYSVTALD